MTELFKEKNSATELRFVLSVILLLVTGYLSLVTAVHAATPVDIYQDMESGSSGNMLTSTIMNASNHGAGSWSINGGMWVSNNNSRPLPGPVIAGGVTYPGTSGSRTWMFNDNNAMNYVRVSFGSSYSRITIACYLTVGPTCLFWNQFDTIVMSGNQGFAVLQMRGNDQDPGPYFRAHSSAPGWVTTFSPNSIEMDAGKTYWVNLYFDGIEGKTYVAAFDPDNGFAQVGITIVAESVPGSTMNGSVNFGRADNHGNNPGCTTQSYFNHILIDYTNAAFPLIPSGGPPDTTPPDNISTVNDGAGNDIDSTLSTTQLQANWTAATDNESPITNYHYAIGTTPGGIQALGWQTLGNVLTVTKTGLTLTIGTTYYFSVKAQSAGGTGNATNSDGQFVEDSNDTTPPDNIATVNDGTGSDTDSISFTTELSANWTPSTDGESNISKYWYAIATTAGGTDVVDWTSTSNGTVTGVTESDLSLVVGVTYYFTVKAENGVSLQSNSTSSDGQCVLSGGTGDGIPPAVFNVNAVNITMTGATITWDTDEPATSRVQYGATASYGNSTLEDGNLVTGHSVNITDLIPGIEYHYRVISKDSSGNEKISIDYAFKTSGNELDARVYPSPYSPSKGNSMRFSIDGTGGGEVKIYTLSGKLVKKLLIGAGESDAIWDVLNEEGNSITTGLYIYSITDGEGNKKTGKLAITQ
jgi:hypothetical protein